MALHIVHREADVPLHNNDDKRVVLDLSDDGEMGYRLGYTPDTLANVQVTMREVLLPKEREQGVGFFEIWRKKLTTTEKRLIVLNDPLSMCHIHELFTLDRANGSDIMQTTLQSLCTFLRTQKYIDLWIVCSPCTSTALGQVIASLK